MKASFLWLKEFVAFDNGPEDIADRLRRAGFDVASLTPVGGPVVNVVAARVESVEKHPNADKLKLCKVFDGRDRWDVVCGAPNVEAGGVYPLARIGATLPGGETIEKRALRGVESNGMLCSAREMGVGEEHAGLYVLPPETPLGEDVNETLALRDVVLDVEITPNRPDALSHWGLGREIAASLGKPFRSPSPARPRAKAVQGLVTNDAPELCSLYVGRVLEGVRVGPSPLGMRLRLERCGFRPINNVVDATNYVMLEFGHPLHVFDRDRLAEGRVVVRQGSAEEQLEGLDGVARSVAGALVIADARRPQALAGILGGQLSAVTEGTVRVLLESARFLPAEIRRTRGRLNLSTESSHRFERGTDDDMAEIASRRATQLILNAAGGRLAGEGAVRQKRAAARRVKCSLKRLTTLLGFPVGRQEAGRALSSLGFRLSGAGDVLAAAPPVHRTDIRETADVAEEIARRLGYDRVPERRRGAFQDRGPLPSTRRWVRVARERLLALGFWEAKNSGLAARADWRRWAGPDGGEPVEIGNPLSTANEDLNQSLLLNLLANTQISRRRGAPDARFFEVGRVFARGEGIVKESDSLAWIAVGAERPSHWKHPSRPLDVYDAKAWAKALIKDWRLQGVRFKGGDRPFLHPSESQSLWRGDHRLGAYGRVHPRHARERDLPPETFVGEIDLSLVAAGEESGIHFQGLSHQPAWIRDFSLVFPASVTWSSIALWIHEKLEHVEAVELFDVFTGSGLPEGRRSLAFRVSVRRPERTLTDAEAAALQEKILEGLAEAFQAVPRAGALPRE